MNHIGLVVLLVDNIDKALEFYQNKLGFKVLESGRRTVIAPKGAQTGILLKKAKTKEQIAAIGNHNPGKVSFYLYVDDFWDHYCSYQAKWVKFLEEPREETYGTVVKFQDPFGNKWDLIQNNT